MCKLGLLTYIEYIVPWLLMPWRLTAPGHQQPWYSIFVLVFGHFRFSEFRLYWWIRVLDSVKCPSFLTNYKAFSATKTPWVELCFGSVGEKIGIKILNIGAGTREMVSAGPDKTLEPFKTAFCAWLWPGRHYLTSCCGAGRGSACHWSRDVLQGL